MVSPSTGRYRQLQFLPTANYTDHYSKVIILTIYCHESWWGWIYQLQWGITDSLSSPLRSLKIPRAAFSASTSCGRRVSENGVLKASSSDSKRCTLLKNWSGHGHAVIWCFLDNVFMLGTDYILFFLLFDWESRLAEHSFLFEKTLANKSRFIDPWLAHTIWIQTWNLVR